MLNILIVLVSVVCSDEVTPCRSTLGIALEAFVRHVFHLCARLAVPVACVCVSSCVSPVTRARLVACPSPAATCPLCAPRFTLVLRTDSFDFVPQPVQGCAQGSVLCSTTRLSLISRLVVVADTRSSRDSVLQRREDTCSSTLQSQHLFS